MSTPSRQITRRTKIEQRLEIHVDMGPIDPASHLEKLRVTRKSDGTEMFVNASDFGENDRDKITGKIVKKFRFSPPHFAVVKGYDAGLDDSFVEPEKVVSLYTEDDMAVMLVEELKQIPEYSRVHLRERERLKTKQDYIDAILRQRKPTAVDETAPTEPRTREAIGD